MGAFIRVLSSDSTTGHGVLRAAFTACVTVVLSAAVTVATVTPAAAVPTVSSGEEPFPGLVFEEIRTTLESGDVVHGTVMRFAIDDPYLSLRTVHAGGAIAGLETVPAMERRFADDGAVAAINGGFWVDPPDGGPTGRAHGVSVSEGQVETGARTLWGNPGYRGTLGLTAEGHVVLSRLAGAFTLTRQDGVVIPIDEVNTQFLNRKGWTEQILLYTPRYPTAVNIPAGGVALQLADLDLRPNRATTPTVIRAVEGGERGAPVSIPGDGGLLVAEPAARAQLDAIEPGATVEIASGIFAVDGDPDVWSHVTSALPGGPYIVRNGARTPSDDWIGEGFSHERHNSPRTPRTAIGVTNDGEILLVTVDGRQPDWSIGMNMWELANLMRELGAVEALSLDGGGSTTATVLGQVRNRPSDLAARPVANALLVQHSYPFDHSAQIGGRDRFDTAAQIALTSYPDGADTVVMATGGDFPDALAGGPLAAQLDAPLLLTHATSVPESTLTALTTLGASRVVVLGGAAAVSSAVVEQLTTRGLTVDRARGPHRYATAAAIAEAIAGDARPDTVIMASGRGFADALVAAAPAGRLGAPILLTEPGELPAATIEYLKSRTPQEILIVGGEAVVHRSVEAAIRELAPLTRVERLSGPDRYATASAVATWADDRLGFGTDVVVARGDLFPDALSGGPYAAARGAALMIVPPGDVLAAQAASSVWLQDHAGPLHRVDLLGGSAVLSLYDRVHLDQLISR